MIEETYRIKNIDCASCAAKIEHGLKSLDGVDDAVLDFASLTLHVKAKNLDSVIQKVKSINPDVELLTLGLY